MFAFFSQWNPRRLLLTLVGGFLLQIVLLPILTNLISTFLQVQYGQQPAGLRWLVVLLLVVTGLVGLVWLVLGLRQRPEHKAMKAQQPRAYPGLIVLVGVRGTRNVEPDALSHNPAIEYHRDGLQAQGKRLRVWLIASEASVPVANQVQERYAATCAVEICRVDDAFHVQHTYDAARAIYANAAQYQLAPSDILADFTGGTTPMSVGLALAAQDQPMQYMYGGRQSIASEPVEIRLVK